MTLFLVIGIGLICWGFQHQRVEAREETFLHYHEKNLWDCDVFKECKWRGKKQEIEEEGLVVVKDEIKTKWCISWVMA